MKKIKEIDIVALQTYGYQSQVVRLIDNCRIPLVLSSMHDDTALTHPPNPAKTIETIFTSSAPLVSALEHLS